MIIMIDWLTDWSFEQYLQKIEARKVLFCVEAKNYSKTRSRLFGRIEFNCNGWGRCGICESPDRRSLKFEIWQMSCDEFSAIRPRYKRYGRNGQQIPLKRTCCSGNHLASLESEEIYKEQSMGSTVLCCALRCGFGEADVKDLWVSGNLAIRYQYEFEARARVVITPNETKPRRAESSRSTSFRINQTQSHHSHPTVKWNSELQAVARHPEQSGRWTHPVSILLKQNISPYTSLRSWDWWLRE